MAHFDGITLVEGAYDLDSTDPNWLKRLAVLSAPVLDRGLGVMGLIVAPDGQVQARQLVGEPEVMAFSQQLMTTQSAQSIRGFLRVTGCSTVRKVLSTVGPEAVRNFEAVASRFGIRDGIGISAHDGEGGAVWLSGPSRVVERLHRVDLRRWSRLTAHLGSAYRLRRRRHLLDARVEAVLSPSGRVEHATGLAREVPGARVALSRAVRRMEQARGALRARPDEALESWPGLVAGRWSLVERVEHDGRRWLLAPLNAPEREGLSELSPRERAVVELARRGHGNKQIAYALGLSVGTVAWALSCAMRKLGVTSRVALVTLAQAPEPAQVARALGPATPAEQAIAHLVVAGHSNAQIAAQRGVTSRTVANQLGRLFERLGVRSRAELSALVRARCSGAGSTWAPEGEVPTSG